MRPPLLETYVKMFNKAARSCHLLRPQDPREQHTAAIGTLQSEMAKKALDIQLPPFKTQRLLANSNTAMRTHANPQVTTVQTQQGP
jgi:hypothetical protein